MNLYVHSVLFLFSPEISRRTSTKYQPSAPFQLESAVVSCGSSSREIGFPNSDKFREWVKHRFRQTCTTDQLYRRLPFLQWSRTYSLSSAFSDAMAGVTVALTAIPQGIAYGAVAGVPVEVQYSHADSRHKLLVFAKSILFK